MTQTQLRVFLGLLNFYGAMVPSGDRAISEQGPEPTEKVLNWLAELKELDLRTVYVKGEEIVVADALSRQPSPNVPSRSLAALTRTACTFNLEQGQAEVLSEYHYRRRHPGVKNAPALAEPLRVAEYEDGGPERNGARPVTPSNESMRAGQPS